MRIKSLNINLKPLIKKLEVSLKRGYTEDVITSTFRSVFKGRGLEFDRFRVYTAADDAKEIDWKASLRTQELLVRVLTEERNINVVFLIDVSNSMIFTSGTKLKCEYAAELVATLSFGMIEAGDNVGLILFNNAIVKQVIGNTGMNQFYRITKHLSNPSFYGGDFDLDLVMKYSTKVFKNGTIIFIISDFIGLKSDWKTYLEIMSRKFDIIGIMVRDIRDNTLEGATGQFVLGDPYTGEDLLIDVKLIKDKYQQSARQQIKEIEDTFGHVRADFIMLDTKEDFVRPIMRLFSMRKSRWK